MVSCKLGLASCPIVSHFPNSVDSNLSSPLGIIQNSSCHHFHNPTRSSSVFCNLHYNAVHWVIQSVILQRRLHPGDRLVWLVSAVFSQTQVYACLTDMHPAQPAVFSRCDSSCLERPPTQHFATISWCLFREVLKSLSSARPLRMSVKDSLSMNWIVHALHILY